jgi:hypothetical protein
MHLTLKRIQDLKKEVGKKKFYKCIFFGLGFPITGIIFAMESNER